MQCAACRALIAVPLCAVHRCPVTPLCTVLMCLLIYIFIQFTLTFEILNKQTKHTMPRQPPTRHSSQALSSAFQQQLQPTTAVAEPGATSRAPGLARVLYVGCGSGVIGLQLLRLRQVTSMTHPLRFLFTRGHWWRAAESVTESAAPHQHPLGSVRSYPIYADVCTLR